MEFTQPLGVGLGLAVRINNQYSCPVCTGRCTDTYATINDTWEISRKTGYLLGNVDMGIWEFVGTGYCVDDMQTMPPTQLMILWKSHKTIAQINCTNESHKTITQGKMTSHPRMEMTNNAFRCSRATQVHMEDLRLVNPTEIHPSRRGEQFKALC